MSVTVREADARDVSLYLQLWPELGLDEAVPSEAQAAAALPRMLVAELDGQSAGVVVGDVEGTVGYLRQIMVRPDLRGRGVGSALVEAVERRVLDRGAGELRLNVKQDNHEALRLYERLGLRVDFRSAALRIGAAVRLALPASGEPVVVYDPSPLETAALEAQFSITAGQLAWFRAQGDSIRAVRAACANDEPLGVMRFSPRFPGAFPFCATSLAAARALLGEAERLRLDARALIGLVIERDVSLVEGLLSAGAHLRFWMVQMARSLV